MGRGGLRKEAWIWACGLYVSANNANARLPSFVCSLARASSVGSDRLVWQSRAEEGERSKPAGRSSNRPSGFAVSRIVGAYVDARIGIVLHPRGGEMKAKAGTLHMRIFSFESNEKQWNNSGKTSMKALLEITNGTHKAFCIVW